MTDVALQKRREQKRQSYHRNKHKYLPRINALTKAKHKALREEQSGEKRPELCEVCGERNKRGEKITALCWDHNHRTGLFRGWLCSRCNLLLGKVDDSSALLLKLADYLTKNSTEKLDTSGAVNDS